MFETRSRGENCYENKWRRRFETYFQRRAGIGDSSHDQQSCCYSDAIFGSGISAISSVPYAFEKVFPVITLGTWTYIFQALLILSLMILRKKFVPAYLCSFLVGFAFSELLDVNEAWINILPKTIPLRVLYFVISYLLICIGIALSNRCGLPIIPTDLFPRELSEIIKVKYSKVKVSFDVICLTITACMTGLILGHINGLGIGTVLAAFTMGKVIGLIGDEMDKHFRFVNFTQHR